MDVSRRGFLKLSGATLAASGLGISLSPAKSHAAALKTIHTKESLTVCPYCSVGCGIIVSVRDGKVINTEGDPDNPINQGSLCPKDGSIYQMANNKNRLDKPLYRAPSATTTGLDPATSGAPTTGVAEVSATAQSAKIRVEGAAGVAGGGGSALGIPAQISPTAQVATAQGAAAQGPLDLAPVIGVSSATGTVPQTALSLGTVGGTSGSGSAGGPYATIAIGSGVAIGAGSAPNATTDSSSRANAQAAAGTGTAPNASLLVSPTAGAAVVTVTGVAPAPQITTSPRVAAGIAAVTIGLAEFDSHETHNDSHVTIYGSRWAAQQVKSGVAQWITHVDMGQHITSTPPNPLTVELFELRTAMESRLVRLWRRPHGL